MKNLIKSVVMAFGAMALVSACEAAGGSETSTSTTGTDNGGNTTGVDGTTGTPAAGEYPAIEIQDFAGNPTLNPCEDGTIQSPGADIDAAQLGAGAYLSGCTLNSEGTCPNNSNNLSSAQGAPTFPDGEAVGEYVSLNGGYLRCNWSDGTVIKDTDTTTITVYEVGKAGAGPGKEEKYSVRVCKSTAGNCSGDSNSAVGETEFPVSALF